MSFRDLLLGKPIPTAEERQQKIGTLEGIPVFGLDALGSAAYGPEAALTLLLPLGVAGLRYIVPISVCIIALLAIVFFSYRQTIAAYPGGGGSYTVASENLGPFPGLLAAAALMIDYILVVAVGISAGVGALVSAVPSLLPHTLGLCLAILFLITLVNLRGVRETGLAFMAPTYVFVATLLGTIAFGVVKSVLAGGHPAPIAAPPAAASASVAVAGGWLLLQSFANGCTAMTGVEAVSNGVRTFRDPRVPNAQRTLTTIIGILIVMLAGIAYLAHAYGIVATRPGAPGYQSVLSMLVAAVAGRGAFYYVTIASILAVLALQANTAFADFPRVCRAVAQNSFLPHTFRYRGRRLVYSEGILVLAAIAGVLLVIFGGVTDRLIPLFAIGAFLAFTMSQAGMVGHWKRQGGRRSRHFMIINAAGAVATGITALIVLVAKFTQGAWVTAILIPALLALMITVRRHYRRTERELDAANALKLKAPERPLVVLAYEAWNKVAENALQFALTLSPEVHAVHVTAEDESCERLLSEWNSRVVAPLRASGMPEPKLVRLPSPYRAVLSPIVSYVLELEVAHPGRLVAVLVPELVETRWYHYLLRTNRAELLKAMLIGKGNQKIVVISLPWYLD
ncbi:MAG TPA: APC family permease [Candidatus Acidoferrales bacterium]|nr:APC family permease [Candidatus Acidoferrales bacterium]